MRGFFCGVGVELSEKYYLRLNQLNVSIMAKIKFGMMMTDARGKLGGQVFSKNRSGAYVRTKVTPVNPQSARQQANRSLLGSMSSQWSGLTEGQRRSWNEGTESWQRTNIFGDLQKPTGKNLFTALNKNRANWFGLGLLLVPPAKVEFPPINRISVSVAAGVITANVDIAEPGDLVMRYRATPPISVGISYVKNLLREVEGFTVVPGTNVITDTYVAAFGQPVVGQKIVFEFYLIAPNGQSGVPFKASTIVTAG